MLRRLLLAILAAGLLVPSTAGAQTVVRGKFASLSRDNLTITYRSSHGRFTAHILGRRRFGLSGKIDGKRLRGTIRTRPARRAGRFSARGSGTLGGRHVRITGGGPTSLRAATLVLR
jgi:hypothetical protein